jgi:5-methylcytosine-specific restriction endonuclease McrA
MVKKELWIFVRENILIWDTCQLCGHPISCGWKLEEIFVLSCQKTKYQPVTDILRVPEKYQKYRYAKKTQISLDPKKC